MTGTTAPGIADVHESLISGAEIQLRDRSLAQQLCSVAGWLPQAARIHADLLARVVSVMAGELGIEQFLDLSCGYSAAHDTSRGPHSPAHTAEAARTVHPQARVLYVDSDHAVYAHARTRPDDSHGDGMKVVRADARDVPGVFDHAGGFFDFTRPVGVVAHGLLQWMDDEDAATTMDGLRAGLPAGSAISLTHATTESAPAAMARLADLYAQAGILFRPRSLEHIQALLGPWDLLDPGIVPTAAWRRLHKLPRRIAAVRPPRQRMPPADLSHAYAGICIDRRPHVTRLPGARPRKDAAARQEAAAVSE
ncbi:SAM-dependent methyltransferase [Streptomyces sp. NPDC048717]|uniref:SAM-dependent methyltransferase n=1 Tax=Streptomyces sp. NPDC048717 TaxID=3154928 RepID=UPI00343C0871